MIIYNNILIRSNTVNTNNIKLLETNEDHQGRIEPPKAARGHATSRSPCIDSIVLSVTKNNAREKSCTVRLRMFNGKFSREMAATKIIATDFDSS